MSTRQAEKSVPVDGLEQDVARGPVLRSSTDANAVGLLNVVCLTAVMLLFGLVARLEWRLNQVEVKSCDCRRAGHAGSGDDMPAASQSLLEGNGHGVFSSMIGLINRQSAIDREIQELEANGVSRQQSPKNDVFDAAAAAVGSDEIHRRVRRSPEPAAGAQSSSKLEPRRGRRPRNEKNRGDNGATKAAKATKNTAILLHMKVHMPGHGHDTKLTVGHAYVYKDWKVAHWALNNPLYTFNHETGRVIVKKKGVYFIYAQIHYHNAAARSSFAIMTVNGADSHNHPLVKCWSSVDVVETSNNARFKTCYVGIAAVLDKNQPVWLEDLYGTFVRPDVESNFFGLIKMADL